MYLEKCLCLLCIILVLYRVCVFLIIGFPLVFWELGKAWYLCAACVTVGPVTFLWVLDLLLGMVFLPFGTWRTNLSHILPPQHGDQVNLRGSYLWEAAPLCLSHG